MNVRRSSLILTFILVPITIIEYFKLPIILERGWYYLALLSTCLLIIKYRKMCTQILPIVSIQLSYYLFELYSTVAAGGESIVDLLQIRQYIFMVIVFACLFSIYRQKVLRILNYIFFACYVINFCTIIKNAAEAKTIFLTADVEYFLGFRYVFCSFSVVSLSLAYYCQRFGKVEVNIYKWLFSLLWITALTAGPSTLLGGLLIYTSILFAIKKEIMLKSIRIRINMILLVVASILVNIGIVFFDIQKIFSFFIKNVLHREVTFTGRSTIWETSIDAFLHGNFWHGLGNSLAFGYNGWGNLGWEDQKYSAHNQILTYLTNTGVIGLAISVLFFALVLRAILSVGEKKLKYALCANYISMLIMSISTQLIPFRFIEIFAMVVVYISKNGGIQRRESIDNEYCSHRIRLG